MYKSLAVLVKFSFFVTILVLLTVIFAQNSIAAPSSKVVKVGENCTKIGKSVKVNDKVLVCVNKNGKKVWAKKNRVVPSKNLLSESTTQRDPVSAKLQAMMDFLPLPNFDSTPPTMSFILEDPSDSQYVNSLERQFLYLSQAYPEFSWHGQGLTLMPKTEEWLVQKMEDLGCHDKAIEWSRKGFHEGTYVWGKGATECTSVQGPVAVIANTGPPWMDPGLGWDMIVSGEFSGIILENSFASNNLPSTSSMPLRYFNVSMPSWMREGAELAFHSVAHAKQTRIWSFYSVDHRVTCGSEKLSDYSGFTTDGTGCHYILGYAANELMLALYGWDAPQRWFSSFNGQLDPYVAFQNAYGEDFSVFERYVTEFVRFRAYGEPMSSELLQRLA